MGRAVWIGAAVLLAAGAAWLLQQNVEQRRQHERVLAEVRAQAEASRAQLAQVVSQQEQIRRTLSEAQETVSGQDKTSLLIRDDFHVSIGMRTAISEYYMSMGRMPATAAEAGLQAADEYRGKTLRSAALMADGGIELTFDANSGVDGGRIRWRPDLSHAQAMGVQWRCETPDYPLIRRALPTCEYQADATAEIAAPHAAKKLP